MEYVFFRCSKSHLFKWYSFLHPYHGELATSFCYVNLFTDFWNLLHGYIHASGLTNAVFLLFTKAFMSYEYWEVYVICTVCQPLTFIETGNASVWIQLSNADTEKGNQVEKNSVVSCKNKMRKESIKSIIQERLFIWRKQQILKADKDKVNWLIQYQASNLLKVPKKFCWELNWLTL